MARFTQLTYTETVFQRFSRGLGEAEAGIYRKAILSQLPDALRELAYRVAQSTDRAYLEKTYSPIALVSGSADLSTNTDMLYDYIRRVTDASSNVYGRLRHRSDLDNPRQEFHFFYAIEGNTFYARQGDGVTVPSNQNFSFIASFIPVVHATVAASTTVPEQLNSLLEAIGHEQFRPPSVGYQRTGQPATA